MWRWDQGHLDYFQFDAIRQIAVYVAAHDFKQAQRAALLTATGLSFSAPATHSPWRNYSRALKVCLLVSEVGQQAQATPVAQILSQPGAAQSYPWTERVMDLHHLLPLSSGTRVESTGTTFDDLVPVCPSCHRAVHRFYDRWLSSNDRKDFKSAHEALGVYNSMKQTFPGLIHA